MSKTCYPKMMSFHWVLEVTWLVLTNQNALFQLVYNIGSRREQINSPQFPRIDGDLKAFLVRLFEQTRRDVSEDATATDVVVQEAAAHFVAALPHRVPELGAVRRTTPDLGSKILNILLQRYEDSSKILIWATQLTFLYWVVCPLIYLQRTDP